MRFQKKSTYCLTDTVTRIHVSPLALNAAHSSHDSLLYTYIIALHTCDLDNLLDMILIRYRIR